MSKTTLTVAQFMTTEPCTVDEDLTLADARERMSNNNIRHLVVTLDGRLAGVLSERDVYLANSLPGVSSKKTNVGAAISGEAFTCAPDALVEDVAAQMEQHRYGCAVVVDGGAVTGIFTTTDALRALREIVSGQPAEALVQPTHKVDQPDERERVRHDSRMGDAIAKPGVGPNPNQGTIR